MALRPSSKPTACAPRRIKRRWEPPLDDYPEELAPEFDEGGAVKTPFEQWWSRVAYAFPNVPEEVAREWLHRHWRHSPFSFLRSADHTFRKVKLHGTDLVDIRWNFNNFAPDNGAAALEHGQWLIEDHYKKWPSWLSAYMLSERQFPTPPIIIDNTDRHVLDSLGPDFYPGAMLLVEGHRRFAMGSYLATSGRMIEPMDFWLMEHA